MLTIAALDIALRELDRKLEFVNASAYVTTTDAIDTLQALRNMLADQAETAERNTTIINDWVERAGETKEPTYAELLQEAFNGKHNFKRAF